MSTTSPSLFQEHARDVYAWAFRLLGHHHDALDVVQDVYLRWSEQCRRGIPRQPRGWLRRTTLNRAIDVRRRRRADAGEKRAAAVAGQGVRRAEADAAALREAVAEAMASLSEAQREALAAKVFEGMTFARIAEESGQAVSTVKTHYVRAVRRLRERLSPNWADELKDR